MGSFTDRKRRFQLRITDDPARLGYVAGLIDGEGCVHIAKLRRGRSYSLTIAVAMTDRGPLEFLASNLGGWVINKKQALENCLQQYLWRASGRDAYLICTAIAPLVIGKSEQVQLGIEFFRFLESAQRGGYRASQLSAESIARCEEFNRKMRLLKRGGARNGGARLPGAFVRRTLTEAGIPILEANRHIGPKK